MGLDPSGAVGSRPGSPAKASVALSALDDDDDRRTTRIQNSAFVSWKEGSDCSSTLGGRDQLVKELRGPTRRALNAFLPPTMDNGPYEHGIGRSGQGYVHFGSLEATAVSDDWTSTELRAWLDKLLDLGGLRRGLVLGCDECPWVDFYRLGEIGQTYSCKRCGANNGLVQARWRIPANEPDWYYDLHPAVAELLRDNGDQALVALIDTSVHPEPQARFGLSSSWYRTAHGGRSLSLTSLSSRMNDWWLVKPKRRGDSTATMTRNAFKMQGNY